MFAEAIKKARMFTRPIVISRLKQDGTCSGGLAAFVVVNSDGWILTALHVLKEHKKLSTNKAKLEDHKRQAEVTCPPGLSQLL